MLTYEGYLTEQKLGRILSLSFEAEIIKQHRFKSEKQTFIVDFFIPEHKLIIEFDGYRHYQVMATIVRDRALDIWAANEGYTVIHHPYWLQLDSRVFYHHFKREVDIRPAYPHGFIDKKALLPADFNSAGWNQFMHQYGALVASDCFSVMREVYESIQQQIKLHNGQIELVIPIAMNNPEAFLKHYPT